MFMIMNELQVVQQNGLYHVLTQQGQLISMHYLPPDGQLMYDNKTLDIITKAEAIRWGILKPKKSSR